MKAFVRILTLTGLIAAAPAIASAQARVPATDSGAIGGDVGIFLPAEDQLKSSPTVEGFYEYYFSPRTSIRMGLGWMNPEFDRDPNSSMRYVRIGADGVYNWEGGAVHPFVGAGLGVYLLQLRDRGESIGDSENKLGATIFGGLEMFATRSVSVKGEARYHLVTDADTFNPDGFSLTLGLKKYF
jgi:opacity protein-like surface antigen